MNVLLVAEDPGIQGGIPRYVVPLAERLASRGHEVHYMYSGGYSQRYDWLFKRRWKLSKSGAVTYHELVNAQSVGVNAGFPTMDVACSDGDLIVSRARALRPDVVHVHSLLGIPVEALAGLAEIRPVIVSFHDFGLICQRRVLVQRDGSVCRTFPWQSDCAQCVDVIHPGRYRLRARLRNTPRAAGLVAIHALERILGGDLTVSENRTEGAGETGAAASTFRRRLRRSVQLVNGSMTRGLAVSHSVRDILVQVGVAPDLVDVMHIGSASADRLARLPLPSGAGHRVTFLLLGGLVPNKGAHILVKAAAQLEDPPRVLIAGSGYEWYEEGLRRGAPASVEFRGAYHPDELPSLLSEADVVVAPAVGPDTSPQVVLEALAAGRPVVGSRIGGIPDFVTDGVNGRLFAPGNSDELARILEELENPKSVESLARGATSSKSLEEHVAELESVYEAAR